MTQNAFAFAASAMIPIGQASTAGNLTLKSTATIAAKEGISMGAGAQKITTDVTGNDAWEQRHLVEPISDGMGGT